MSEPKTILVVDDEASLREIMQAQLEAFGFRVVTASNGAEAIHQAETIQPDLVLMDIHLGEKETGTDIALTMKQNPRTRSVKITFLSSLKEPWPGVSGENDKVAKEIGMEDYLLKTDDPQVNAEKIKKLLADAPLASPPQVITTEPQPQSQA